MDANGSDTPYHELAHCLGYGHSGNMTYYPAEGGFPTICMKVYSQLSVSKKLPVYSRRFLHTRRNKNLVENKNVYTSSKYIIDDPELDAIDGGLGLAPMETDRAGDEGSPLSFTLSVLDIPGATVETFHPKAVHLYGNTLYVANDAPGHYSLEVFDVSSGNVRHVKSMVEWMNGDKKETFAGEPNGVTRSYGKIYVTNTGSRTDVFDAETYEFITCIGTGTWGEGGYQTVHAFDVTASQGAVFIRDKRKLVVVLEQDVQPGSAARVPIYSRSVNLQEAMGTYAVAARNDGFLYVTAQNKNIIYLFDPADIRAGDTGFAPYLVTLGFEKSPQSIAFVGDRLFVTLRVDDKRSELWEISPKNGKLLQDFTDSMVYPEKIPDNLDYDKMYSGILKKLKAEAESNINKQEQMLADYNADPDSFKVSKTAKHSYDRDKAVAYSYKWVNGESVVRNPAYSDYAIYGGNCQNYVSQSLFASGIPMDWSGSEQWKWFDDESDLSELPTGRSGSWSGTQYFYEYCNKNTGKGIVAETDGNIFSAQPGDVIQYVVDGWAHHSVIVTKVIYDDDGNVVDLLINSNTTDRVDYPMSAYGYTDIRLIKIIGYNDK